jgi:WD40 repeat protein
MISALAVSPDGRLLASGSLYQDPTIRIWDTTNGKLLRRLEGHSGWVASLTFAKEGQRLYSASSDQSIRIWDVNTWNEITVLRGHVGEVYSLAVAERSHLVASTGRDGNLMLWSNRDVNGKTGYFTIPKNISGNRYEFLDKSHLLLRPHRQEISLLDLKAASDPVPMSELGSADNVIPTTGTNLLCSWDGTNQMIVREWTGSNFLFCRSVTVAREHKPWMTFYSGRKLLIWSDGSSSLHEINLNDSNRVVEVRCDVEISEVAGLSHDGHLLLARDTNGFAHVLNADTGRTLVSAGQSTLAAFALNDNVLIACAHRDDNHEVSFYDLNEPEKAPRHVAGRFYPSTLAVSPDSRLAALSTESGEVRLFDPANGELIEVLDAHLNAAFGVAFSPDGKRLISSSGGREAVKLWDVRTRQELLTLSGEGTLSEAQWGNDGNAIVAGFPLQIWRAPSWEEIRAIEAREPRDGAVP